MLDKNLAFQSGILSARDTFLRVPKKCEGVTQSPYKSSNRANFQCVCEVEILEMVFTELQQNVTIMEDKFELQSTYLFDHFIEVTLTEVDIFQQLSAMASRVH